MMRAQPKYIAPDLMSKMLSSAPAARTVAAERDGVLPDGFFATTNLPTYIKGPDGRWTLPREPRMDGVLVCEADRREQPYRVVEGRRVKSGDAIVVGLA